MSNTIRSAPATPTGRSANPGSKARKFRSLQGTFPRPAPQLHLPKRLQNRAHKSHGTVKITAKPSEEHSFGALKQQEHAHTYLHESVIFLNGQRYAFTLKVPLLKPFETLSGEEKGQLQATIDEYKKVFLIDLQKRLGDSRPIQAGSDFNVFFSKEGYTAYKPDYSKFFDPERQDIEEAKKTGHAKALVEANDETAQTLSSAVYAGSIKGIRDALKTPKLQELVNSAKKETKPPISETTLHPLGLENKNTNACHLNAIFQQLARNPELRKDLQNKERFVNGEQNPLYQALQNYWKLASSDGAKEPLNLNALMEALNFPKEESDDPNAPVRWKQQDAHETLQILEKQLVRSEQGAFYGATKTQLFNKKTKHWDDRKEDKHTITQLSFIPKEGEKIEDLLIEESELDENFAEKEYTHRREALATAPKVLTINARRAEVNTNKEKIEIQESLILPEAVDKEKTEYELQSFSCHLGEDNAGHYVSYYKEGDHYFLANDERVTKVSKETFLENAQSAYVLMYNQKALQEVQMPTKNTPVRSETIEHTTIDLEDGSYQNLPKEFAIVNFSNESLSLIQPIVQKAREGEDLKAAILRAKTEEIASRFFLKRWFLGQTNYSLGEDQVLKTGSTGSVVFHVNVKNLSKAVQNILKKATDAKIEEVALEVGEEYQEQVKKAVEKYARDNKTNIHVVKHVKIINPKAPIKNPPPISPPPVSKAEKKKELAKAAIENGEVIFSTTTNGAQIILEKANSAKGDRSNKYDSQSSYETFLQQPEKREEAITIDFSGHLNYRDSPLTLKYKSENFADFVQDLQTRPFCAKTLHVIVPEGIEEELIEAFKTAANRAQRQEPPKKQEPTPPKSDSQNTGTRKSTKKRKSKKARTSAPLKSNKPAPKSKPAPKNDAAQPPQSGLWQGVKDQVSSTADAVKQVSSWIL